MVLVVVYVVLIFAVSSIPRLAAPGPEFVASDKVAHAVEYWVLGVLLFRAIRWDVSSSRWATFGFVLSVAATIGALNEFYQGFIPGRDMSIGDWAANLLGSAAGAAAGVFTRLGGPGPAVAGEVQRGRLS
jgi:VanZ family protein